MQTLESNFRRGKEQVVCLIAGDFNLVHEEDEVFDGYFSAASSSASVFFRDTWHDSAPQGDLGHTYDPTNNSRAAISRRPPRRLDRIFCGSCTTSESLLHSKAGYLIGKLDTARFLRLRQKKGHQSQAAALANHHRHHYPFCFDDQWRRTSSSADGPM